MTAARLELTRDQILAFRRRVGALDQRMSPGGRSLRKAAGVGLQDSMPRAALLSIHARVEDAEPTTWEDPSLVQLWGPRYSVFVVAGDDVAVFTVGRLPDDGDERQRAEDLAIRVSEFLAGRTMSSNEVGRALGIHPNALRYAAPTGTILLRWDGARRPVVWSVPRPDVEPADARREMARRYLHIFGPTTPGSFAEWAGIRPPRATATFESLRRSLTPVVTPFGDAWILSRDEKELRAEGGPPAPARLLPSGDAYFLLWGDDRQLLVPDTDRRNALWTPRVWPGAVLVDGVIVGTWRRAQNKMTIEPWRRLSRPQRESVEVEAESLPLPGIGRMSVRWN